MKDWKFYDKYVATSCMRPAVVWLCGARFVAAVAAAFFFFTANAKARHHSHNATSDNDARCCRCQTRSDSFSQARKEDAQAFWRDPIVSKAVRCSRWAVCVCCLLSSFSSDHSNILPHEIHAHFATVHMRTQRHVTPRCRCRRRRARAGCLRSGSTTRRCS